MSLCQVISIWIREIPGHLKTQEMCNEAVHIEPCSFQFFPDHLKTQKMYNEIMPIDPAAFFVFSTVLKLRRCMKKQLRLPHGSFTMSFITLRHNKCVTVVKKNPFCWIYIPDWFVKLKEMWYKGSVNDDELFTWYEGYKKRKAQKAKLKEESIPIAWHPARMQDWCMSEDERERITEIFA